MELSVFLAALFEHGRLRVGRWGAEDEPAGPAPALAVLVEFDQAWRLEFPGDAPPLVAEAAHWAGRVFYRACQLAVYRDVDAATGLAALAIAGPDGANPAAHYAVDLVFRFLPDLARLARSAAQADPLVEHLRGWGAAWPLSSVGMAGVAPRSIEPIAAHAGLLWLYADRIVRQADVSRLADPRVRQAVRAALGAHDDLAPALAKALHEADLAEAVP
jgi:hypothetical protein